MMMRKHMGYVNSGSSSSSSSDAAAQPPETKRPRMTNLSAEDAVRAERTRNMYFGEAPNASEGEFVDLRTSEAKKVKGLVCGGLFKIIDEVLANAGDQAKRPGTDVKHVWVTFRESDGKFTVRNDGKGIPLEDVILADGRKVNSVSAAFGHLHTGTNFVDDTTTEGLATGGCNGVGVKLANLYSTWMCVENRDGKKDCTVVFRDQMRHKGTPTMKKIKNFRGGGVRVSLIPCYDIFGLAPQAPCIKAFIHRRCCELAATTKGVKFHLKFDEEEEAEIKCGSILKYARMYTPTAVQLCDDGKAWSVAIGPRLSDDAPEHVSFCNGIPTHRGGTHVDAVKKAIYSEIAAKLSTKDCTVKTRFLAENVTLFVSHNMLSPEFNDQGKSMLVTRIRGKPPLGKKEVAKAAGAVRAHILGLMSQKIEQDASSVSRRKRGERIEKLDDAPYAGKKGKFCKLILTEGDSAGALALAGRAALPEKERKSVGVFRLKGKPLNAREASSKKLTQNKELMNLVKSLGITYGTDYSSDEAFERLRYKQVWLMCDADVDGHHITSLIINFFAAKFPSLLRRRNFLVQFRTPCRRLTRAGESIDFFTDAEYEEWARAHDPAPYAQKFFKGLGGWNRDEAKKFFRNLERYLVYFDYHEEASMASIERVFSAEKVKDRKEWITSPPAPAPSGQRMTHNGYIDHYMHSYCEENVLRMIPSTFDGLKPSQRKALYAMMKNYRTKEVKVATLAGDVIKYGYHHGEKSMTDTVVRLAADYMGSNNLPILYGNGQFGTRMQMGKDAAAPRYIFTSLQEYTEHLFPAHVNSVLDHVVEDGKVVEPRYYFPCVPLLLINGARGIASGFSTVVLPHKLEDVVEATRALIAGKEPPSLMPHWRGFKGEVSMEGAKVTVTGVQQSQGSKTVITELPPMLATEKFYDTLDKRNINFQTDCDGESVHIVVDSSAERQDLSQTFSEANMYVLDAENRLRKHPSVASILQAYHEEGKKVYAKSLAKLREEAQRDCEYHERKAAYIQLWLDKRVQAPIRPDELCARMQEVGFAGETPDTVKDLLRLTFSVISVTGIDAEQRKARAAREEVARLQSLTWQALWESDIQKFTAATLST